MAYSIDFRQKALDHYEQHGNISQTARTFRITNRTLYQWIALKKETGSLQHRTKGGNSERIDKEELRRYVAEHPDAYQYEIAQHLGCTASNVGYLLKTLKITR
ncbi:IS630 transposase-related protein, partial [Neisseria mucosa]